MELFVWVFSVLLQVWELVEIGVEG